MSIDQPNQTKAVVRNFIEQELLNGRKETLDEKTDLIDRGIIDSMSLLRLVTFIEENCHIQVPDEEILPENFRSLAAIQTFIAQRQGASEPRKN